MNLYTCVTIDFPWFGGWDWELCVSLDLNDWVWLYWFKDSGDNSETKLGEEFNLTGKYWDGNFQILCIRFGLEGAKG